MTSLVIRNQRWSLLTIIRLLPLWGLVVGVWWGGGWGSVDVELTERSFDAEEILRRFGSAGPFGFDAFHLFAFEQKVAAVCHSFFPVFCIDFIWWMLLLLLLLWVGCGRMVEDGRRWLRMINGSSTANQQPTNWLHWLQRISDRFNLLIERKLPVNWAIGIPSPPYSLGRIFLDTCLYRESISLPWIFIWIELRPEPMDWVNNESMTSNQLINEIPSLSSWPTLKCS